MMVFFLVLALHGLFFVSDDGSGLDPHGGTRTAACSDEGSGLDPHGGPCTRTFSTDEGNGFDPHG